MNEERRSPESEAGSPSAVREPLDGYQRKLLIFLSVASFFEGYDFIALTQILPNLRADMGISRETAGQLVALINAGTIAAYFLIRGADRWGRRKVLTTTIAGYTLMTFLTGFAPSPWAFATCQMVARIFLIAEYVTGMVVASEEFPRTRRGDAIGLVAAFSSLGAIVCAGLVPLLVKSAYGWRSVYFVSILPLLFMAYARRGLHETRRFAERALDSESVATAKKSLFYIFRTPYRRRVFELGLIWFVAFVATQNGVLFWKDFAVNERGFTDRQVGASISIAAVVALPVVFTVGRLLDSFGRRPAAALVFTAGALGTWGCYTLHGQGPLTVALVLAIFSSSAFLPILNALTTERFPTDIRAEGFAWSNNLLGRIGYVLSPLVVGKVANDLGFGPVIRWTAIFPIVSIGLVYWLLPETKGKTLEETAAL